MVGYHRDAYKYYQNRTHTQILNLVQFKVVDFFGRHTEFLSQNRQKRWVVILLYARGKGCLLARIVSIELIRDLAENRNELRLLVKLEAIINVPVDLSTRKP